MRHFFTSLILLITLHAHSQFEGTEQQTTFERSANVNRATQGWYNYGTQVVDLLGSYSYFRNNLFPDSTVVVEFSSGYGPVWKHSLGQMFDPSSFYYDAIGSGHPTIDSVTAYKVDSVGLWYRYFRHQDVAPDTLLVQVYHHNDIYFNADPGWSSGASYARVDYDYTVRKGADPMLEIEYLLTVDDTATENQGFLSIPINVAVNAGEKIAVTYTYFPGNPYNVGDTIDQYSTPKPTNRINSLLVYEVRDETPYIEPGFYNHEMRVTQSVRYNYNTNGWNGRYIPGTAYASSSGIYHLDVEFHATTCDPIEMTYTSSDASCGSTDGSSSITATGNSPFEYLWETGSTTDSETGLGAGTYDITITDSFGCSEVKQALVSNNLAINSTITDVLCNGQANGSLTLELDTSYTYNWSNGNSSNNASNLAAGTYLVTTTDTLGCVNIQDFEINEPELLSSVATSISMSSGGNTASATVDANGGTTPYSYNWQSGESSQTAVSLSSGTSWVTVTDANGCIAVANTSIPNSISELEKEIRLRLYPNPANQELLISSDVQMHFIQVVNSVGQPVLISNPQNTMERVDCSQLPNGVYHLTVGTRSGTLNRKVIITH